MTRLLLILCTGLLSNGYCNYVSYSSAPVTRSRVSKSGSGINTENRRGSAWWFDGGHSNRGSGESRGGRGYDSGGYNGYRGSGKYDDQDETGNSGYRESVDGYGETNYRSGEKSSGGGRGSNRYRGNLDDRKETTDDEGYGNNRGGHSEIVKGYKGHEDSDSNHYSRQGPSGDGYGAYSNSHDVNRGSTDGNYYHKGSSDERPGSYSGYKEKKSGDGYSGGKDGGSGIYDHSNSGRGDTTGNHGRHRYSDDDHAGNSKYSGLNSGGRGGTGGNLGHERDSGDGNGKDKIAVPWWFDGGKKDLPEYKDHKSHGRGDQDNDGAWWFNGGNKNVGRFKDNIKDSISINKSYKQNKQSQKDETSSLLSVEIKSKSNEDDLVSAEPNTRSITRTSPSAVYYEDSDELGNIRFGGYSDSKERGRAPDGPIDKFSEIISDHSGSDEQGNVNDMRDMAKTDNTIRDYKNNDLSSIETDSGEKAKYDVSEHEDNDEVSGRNDDFNSIFHNKESSTEPSGSTEGHGSTRNGPIDRGNINDHDQEKDDNPDIIDDGQKRGIEHSETDGGLELSSKTEGSHNVHDTYISAASYRDTTNSNENAHETDNDPDIIDDDQKSSIKHADSDGSQELSSKTGGTRTVNDTYADVPQDSSTLNDVSRSDKGSDELAQSKVNQDDQENNGNESGESGGENENVYNDSDDSAKDSDEQDEGRNDPARSASDHRLSDDNADSETGYEKNGGGFTDRNESVGDSQDHSDEPGNVVSVYTDNDDIRNNAGSHIPVNDDRLSRNNKSGVSVEENFESRGDRDEHDDSAQDPLRSRNNFDGSGELDDFDGRSHENQEKAHEDSNKSFDSTVIHRGSNEQGDIRVGITWDKNKSDDGDYEESRRFSNVSSTQGTTGDKEENFDDPNDSRKRDERFIDYREGKEPGNSSIVGDLLRKLTLT